MVFTTVEWNHPWSSVGWENSVIFQLHNHLIPHWINWIMLCVKLKIMLLFSASENFGDISPNSNCIVVIWMMQSTKEWKRVTASQGRYFWHSVEREVIPLDDSFCLSLCRQEESAGDWKKQRGKKQKKLMQADRDRVFSPKCWILSVQCLNWE